MATDFVDDDLLRPPAPPHSRPPIPVAEGGGYDRTKHRLEEQESQASDELDRIRKRSEEIERQRQTLRALRGKQGEFDRSHRDLGERLQRHVVLLKNEEEQAARAATVCHEVRKRFETLQEELDRIDPDAWSDATHEADLTQALAQIEAARAVFRKGVDRVTALGWRPDGDPAPRSEDRLEAGLLEPSRRFGDWLKIGAALTLPLAVVLIVLLTVYLFASQSAGAPAAPLP